MCVNSRKTRRGNDKRRRRNGFRPVRRTRFEDRPVVVLITTAAATVRGRVRRRNDLVPIRYTRTRHIERVLS